MLRYIKQTEKCIIRKFTLIIFNLITAVPSDYDANYYAEQPQNVLPLQTEGVDIQPNSNLDQQNDMNQNYSDSQQQNLDNVEQYPNKDNSVAEYSYQDEYNNTNQTIETPNENQIMTQENQGIDYDGMEKSNYEQPENFVEKYENEGNEDTEVDESFSGTTTITGSETTVTSSNTDSTASKSEQIKKKKSVEFVEEPIFKENPNVDNPINLDDELQSTTNAAPLVSSANTTTMSTPKDEVKMIKKLLGDESDENSIKSNIVQSIEKENVDESDFDFSTNSEVN